MSQSNDRYQVVIAKYGTRQTVRSDVYLNYPLYGQADGPIEMDYFFWVVRNHERTIVVDTGFSRRGGDVRGRTTLVPVPQLFSRIGVDPQSSPLVVITHAHYDHIGNLDHFPTSEVVMARAEFEFWSSRHAGRALFHHSVEDEELAGLRRINDEGRLRLFDDWLDIAPGVHALVVGGHTPGQCVVRVATDEGTVLLASDAIHYYEEYERDMLFTSVADLVEMYEAFDTIREMERLGSIDHLVAGHDPNTLRRFAPIDGEFDGLVATIGSLTNTTSVVA
ncbi:MAG: N-acyl homoserine lactonase family protein [Acidimicrobiales bacterium]